MLIFILYISFSIKEHGSYSDIDSLVTTDSQSFFNIVINLYNSLVYHNFPISLQSMGWKIYLTNSKPRKPLIV